MPKIKRTLHVCKHLVENNIPIEGSTINSTGNPSEGIILCDDCAEELFRGRLHEPSVLIYTFQDEIEAREYNNKE